MENDKKEVYFDEWCPQCKYHDTPEVEDPCNQCLAEGSNNNSHKPLYFKEA